MAPHDEKLRLAQLQPSTPCSGLIHRAEPGETLVIISDRYGIPLTDLLTANPGITNPNLGIAGTEVCLPVPQVPGLPLHPPMPPGIPPSIMRS